MRSDAHQRNFDWLCSPQASPGTCLFLKDRDPANTTDVRVNAHFSRTRRHAISYRPNAFEPMRCFMKKNLRSTLQLIAWLSWCALFACSAKAVIFTNDTVIAYNDFSYDGADVVMSNCVVNIDGAHTFSSLGIF